MSIDYGLISANDHQRLGAFASAAYSSIQGVQHTFLLAEKALALTSEGSFCECGVANGALAATMAYALLKHGQQARELHLCDSFEGIPLAGPKDNDQPGIGHFIADVNLPLEQRLKSSGISGAAVDTVKSNFYQWGLEGVPTHYYKGWFQHTLPELKDKLPRLAMLRLDADLYESTKCILENLYDLVLPGGVCLLDDYPLPGSRAAFEEFFGDALPEVRVEVDTGAAYWIKD